MKAGSWKKLCVTCSFTVFVTIRYMRLKQARPSAGGRAASISCMRAMASEIDVTGPVGIGGKGSLAITRPYPNGPP